MSAHDADDSALPVNTALPVTTAVNDVNRHLTFHRLFLPVWERNADNEATTGGGTARTFAQHRDRVLRLANAMASELSLSRTGRFAVLALNSPEYLELYHAAYLGGGIINPLNIRLAAEEIAFVLADSGTEVVFVDARFAPLIDGIRDRVDSLRSVILIGSEGGAGDLRVDGRYEDVLQAGSPDVTPETDESDPVCLLYTGGTTGLPKGVLHTQRSHVMTAQIGQAFFDFADGDRFLAATPLFHGASFGAFLVAPSVGCPVDVLPAFDPAGFQALVAASGATHAVLVPTMIRMLLDDPGFDAGALGSLDLLMYGGSPMPLGVLRRLMEAMPALDVVQGYGMTEGVPITRLDAESHRRGGAILGSAGQALPGVTITVQDDDGAILPSGTTGELCMRSGLYMAGYWNRPEETAAALRGGWYRSGDVGYIDDEGYVFLVDRAKDMIVSGGENVYSSEVESAISTHPDVADVAVIGVPSDDWGEAVHAIVVLRPSAELDGEAIIAHARTAIAGYKVPSSVEVRTEPLPLSGAGKTLKRALREPFWADRDRRVN